MTKQIKLFMSKADVQAKIRLLREELENRHKTGLAKIASTDGEPIATEKLQTELYSLIYKLSKME